MAYSTVTQHPKGYPFTSVMAAPFDADNTGVLDASSAFAEVFVYLSNSGTVWVPKGTYKIDENVTVPAGITLFVSAGVTFTIAIDKVFSIAGYLIAPPDITFGGSGTYTIAAGHTLFDAFEISVVGSDFDASVPTTGVLFIDKATTMTESVTIPAGVELWFVKGGIVSVPTGKTLIINGPIDAGPFQIFTWVGTGTVTFGNSCKVGHAEWWGAKGDDSTDCTAAINKAGASGLNKLLVQNGTYRVTNLVFASSILIEGTRGSTIKQPVVSGVAVKFYHATTALDFAGLKDIRIVGAATTAVAGNHGVWVENVTHHLILNNVYITAFGADGFRCEGSTWRSNIDNLLITYCYGWGIQGLQGGLGYLWNANVSNNVSILWCKNGLKLESCYSHTFNGLVIEDDSGSMNPTEKFIYISAGWGIVFNNLYIETDYCNTNIIEFTGTDTSGFYGGQITGTSANITDFIKFTANVSSSFVRDMRITTSGSGYSTRAINIAAATCQYNVIENCRITGFTAKVVDAGYFNRVSEGSWFTAYQSDSPALLGQGSTANHMAFTARVTGDTYDRYRVTAGGEIVWGSGAATPDVNLYRSAANVLKTDDSLIVGVVAEHADNAAAVAAGLAVGTLYRTGDALKVVH
jgi:hypothetical protein